MMDRPGRCQAQEGQMETKSREEAVEREYV